MYYHFPYFLQPLYKYFKHKLKQRNCAPSLSLRLIAAWPNRVLLVKFYDVSNRKIRSFPHKNAFVNFIILTIGKHAAPCVSIISVSIWKAPNFAMNFEFLAEKTLSLLKWRRLPKISLKTKMYVYRFSEKPLTFVIR